MKYLLALLKLTLVLLLTGGYAVAGEPAVTLVKNGTATGIILLPGKTELEKLLESAVRTLQMNPDNRGIPVDSLQHLAWQLLAGKWEKNQVGANTKLQDEELLAASELQEFIYKISGATLEIKRMPDAGPDAGPGELYMQPTHSWNRWVSAG